VRTTVTLDEDVARRLEELRRERRISFKEAINSTLRRGLIEPRPRKRFKQRTYSMGLRPGIDLTHAIRLSADLEDEEIIRKLELGK
jgi:hypothetical protein